jgi:hypothetical protein
MSKRGRGSQKVTFTVVAKLPRAPQQVRQERVEEDVESHASDEPTDADTLNSDDDPEDDYHDSDDSDFIAPSDDDDDDGDGGVEEPKQRLAIEALQQKVAGLEEQHERQQRAFGVLLHQHKRLLNSIEDCD